MVNVPAAPRAAEEEEDRISALIPTLPPVTSLPPSLPEIDSESQRSFREALQNESATVPVRSDSHSHLDSDRSHHTTQGSRHQSWSIPQGVLTRETGEHVRSSQALAPAQPMSHQERSVRSQSSEDFIPERQSSNQARERTVESADEPPTQRPRLENPAISIRWSKVDELGHWVPATVAEDEGDMWTETDPEVLWQQQVDDHIWENNGQPACLPQEECDELFSNTSDNLTAHVCFSRSEFTGSTATKMTRGDELPQHLILESEWPRVLQATVSGRPFLDTSAVTIISPTAAKDARKHWSHRIVPSRDTSTVRNPESLLEPRQKQNVGGLRQHRKHHQSTLSFSLQRFYNGKLASVISSPLSCRVTRISPIGHMASSAQDFHLVAFLSPTGPGSRRVP